LGWKAAFFSEIEKFPRAVLKHHYPDIPLHGDFTTIKEKDYDSIDLLVGGTPCQSFSVAGLRKGMADDRGNLALEYLRLAQRLRPQWLVWENVPGVRSSWTDEETFTPSEESRALLRAEGLDPGDFEEVDQTHDLDCFLAGLQELGYGFAMRSFDAQYFDLAQRRERVFVVGYLGDWRPAAAVLFERHCLSGDTPPSREKGKGITHDIAPSLRASGPGGSNVGDTRGQDPIVAVRTANTSANGHGVAESVVHTLDGTQGQAIKQGAVIRRLTPREWERLMGFPDDYTRIPWTKKDREHCPDGPRYKALGNSMATLVMGWIGKRIDAVEEVLRAA
jgi:DNA (cytosine-5)-methyltransferase 1